MARRRSGIQVGQCVAEKGSDDLEQVDCSSPDSVGTVTFVSTDASTSENAALDLCDKHAADTAYTSALSDGGQGAVICVAGKLRTSERECGPHPARYRVWP
jgi:hypothetical protein